MPEAQQELVREEEAVSQTWERPPERFGCYVALRYSCGHTLLRDVTDIVIVRGITDDMLWLTEFVDVDHPCHSCGGIRSESDLSIWELV